MMIRKYRICSLLVSAALLGGAAADSTPAEPLPAAESVRLNGTVTDRSGAQLPRTLVQVRGSDGRLAASAQTNSRGEFVMDLTEGDYTISAMLAGFAPLKDRPLRVAAGLPPLTLTLEIPSLHQAVLAGVGIGSISFFSRARMEGLVRVLPRYTSADLPVSIVAPSKRLEPARVVLLRDFLAAKLSSLPWRG